MSDYFVLHFFVFIFFLFVIVGVPLCVVVNKQASVRAHGSVYEISRALYGVGRFVGWKKS